MFSRLSAVYRNSCHSRQICRCDNISGTVSATGRFSGLVCGYPQLSETADRRPAGARLCVVTESYWPGTPNAPTQGANGENDSVAFKIGGLITIANIVHRKIGIYSTDK